MRRVLSRAVPVVVVALAAGAAARLLGSGPLLVAVVTRSSSGSVIGSSEANAGVLFAEEVRASRLKVFPLDDHWRPAVTRQRIAEARAQGVRFFITSHPSNCAVEVAPMFGDADAALMIVAASTTDVLTGQDDGVLRVVPEVGQEQRELARHVAERGAHRILVVQDTGNRPYTDPAFREFSEELARHGRFQIARREVLVSSCRPDELREFLAQPADLLYILAGSYQPAIGTIAQLFCLQSETAPILLTPWTRSPAVMEAAGPAVRRIILPAHYPARGADPAIHSYVTRFRARFGYDPASMSVSVRQALELLDAAVRAGHRTPRQVKRWLLDHSPHHTSLGPVCFDGYGDATTGFYFLTDLRQEFDE